jgi:hypothetical protein
VSSFLLDDPNIPDAVKEESAKTAAAYYRQAWEYTKPQQGKLILMSGLSGAGKSTTAKDLARKLNAVHLRSDAVRKHLAGIPLLERGGDEIYTPEMTEKTYSRLLALGIILANQGWSVILDAKYDRQDLRSAAISQATQHQLPIHIINCSAPVEVLTQRLLQRTGDIADATADLLASQIKQFEPFTGQEQPYLTVVNTTEPLEAQLSALI